MVYYNRYLDQHLDYKVDKSSTSDRYSAYIRIRQPYDVVKLLTSGVHHLLGDKA